MRSNAQPAVPPPICRCAFRNLAELRSGAVAIVGEALDEIHGPARARAFVQNFVVRRALDLAVPRWMARLMLSAGICWPRASATALRKRGLALGSPPPMRAAVTISRMSLVRPLPRAASVAPFFRLMVAHLE
jgi:hypothetical protein